MPANEGSELRAVASDGQGPTNGFARISLVNETSAPELTLKLKGKAKSFGFGEDVGFTVESAALPAAATVSVKARYIPETGHDAGGPQFSPDITKLVTANQCLACHQVDVTSAGPSYLNVSLKYRDQPDAVSVLKAKLKSGGAGVWGELPMPPQVALKEADADTILKAILGLSEGVSETKGTLAGKLTLAPKPSVPTTGGAWEFSAEAPGFTTAKFRIPAK